MYNIENEGESDHSKLKSGEWLIQRVKNSQRNEIIYLQEKTYKFHSLHIHHPISIIGKAGTVLEVDGGQIKIDFGDNNEELGPEYVEKKDPFKPWIEQGTPLTIKKLKVAKIHVCEILFNRTKASQENETSRKLNLSKEGKQFTFGDNK